MGRRVIAVLFGLALLAGCSRADIAQPKFKATLSKNLKGRGVSSAEVSCITEQIYRQLPQDEINTLYKADLAKHVPKATLTKFNAIAEACMKGEPG
jgi:hypothetical protein